jgi:hypothetical protein
MVLFFCAVCYSKAAEGIGRRGVRNFDFVNRRPKIWEAVNIHMNYITIVY